MSPTAPPDVNVPVPAVPYAVRAVFSADAFTVGATFKPQARFQLKFPVATTFSNYEIVTINKSGESASDYIYIHAAAGAEHRGSFSSGVIFSSATFAGGLDIQTDFTRVKTLFPFKPNMGMRLE